MKTTLKQIDHCAGFTALELLVVIGTLTALGFLSITALAHTQSSSDRAVCASNLRRLMQAWQMYPDDNAGSLMAHASSGTPRPWVGGNLDLTPANQDNSNPLKLTNATYAAMAPYVNSPQLFRCPTDPTTLVVGGVPKLRVRSYSMNEMVGSPGPSFWNPSHVVMSNIFQVSQPNNTFVLLEEHPGSINDGSIIIDVASSGSPSGVKIIDFPAAFHLSGADISFSDGHVEYWQWSDARTSPPIGSTLSFNIPSPNNPDIVRLQTVTSYRP